MSTNTKRAKTFPTAYTAAWWHASLQAFLFVLLLVTAPNIPRLDVAILMSLAVISGFHVLVVERNASLRPSRHQAPLLFWSLLALSGYLFLNALWAEKTGEALGKAGLFVLLITSVHVTTASLATQSDISLRRLATMVVGAALIGTSLVCFEFLTEHLIERTIYTYWPAARPSTKAIDILMNIGGDHFIELPESEYHKHLENVVILVSPSATNRNLTLLLLLVWPVMNLAAQLRERRMRFVVMSLIGCASVISVFQGISQTAQLALAGGIAAFLAALALPRVVHWCILGAWCTAVMLAVPLAEAPHRAGWHKADWLFESARERIVIWANTVERVKQTPVLGVGIRSTRYINRRIKKETGATDRHSFKKLALHSHNQFLQLWFELGAVGAILVLATGLGLLRCMDKLDEGLKPYAYATFVTACIVAAFGWGLWQTWLLSGYALTIILIYLANGFYARKPAAQAA